MFQSVLLISYEYPLLNVMVEFLSNQILTSL